MTYKYTKRHTIIFAPIARLAKRTNGKPIFKPKKAIARYIGKTGNKVLPG
jgi:hypothetical protein